MIEDSCVKVVSAINGFEVRREWSAMGPHICRKINLVAFVIYGWGVKRSICSRGLEVPQTVGKTFVPRMHSVRRFCSWGLRRQSGLSGRGFGVRRERPRWLGVLVFGGSSVSFTLLKIISISCTCTSAAVVCCFLLLPFLLYRVFSSPLPPPSIIALAPVIDSRKWKGKKCYSRLGWSKLAQSA